MDQVALRLEGNAGWTYLGGNDEARKPLEVILRAFDCDVEFAVGEAGPAGSGDTGVPMGEPVTVPVGEGRRLAGKHFFARAASSCRVSYRGI